MTSLKDLKAARASMTPGTWWIEESDGSVSAGEVDNATAVGDVDWSDGDIGGVLATHNAADVLIKVVEAALAWSLDTEKTYHKAVLLNALAKVSP